MPSVNNLPRWKTALLGDVGIPLVTATACYLHPLTTALPQAGRLAAACCPIKNGNQKTYQKKENSICIDYPRDLLSGVISCYIFLFVLFQRGVS